jgi:preprotein translocase subunit SecG
MNWLYTAAIIVHVLLAAAITGLVLLQRGRGADAGAGFGSGASGTVFGARGSASFMSRSTAALAGLFIGTSLLLAALGGRRPDAPSSVTDRVNVEEPATPPATVPPALVPAPMDSAPTTATPTTPPAETPPAAATDQGATQAPSPQPPSQ